MASSFYSDRDLDLIPELTFSFVEEYIKSNKISSGQKSINKGFKYFSEGYITDLRVQKITEGCKITGKCFRSQRKNEEPHSIAVSFNKVSQSPEIITATCSCPIGLSGACGHISGLLYQIAKYKILCLRALPDDVAKTSMPQTWHTPRGDKIRAKAVQDLSVSGYHCSDLSRDSTPGTTKSTLYNPVCGHTVDWSSKYDQLKKLPSNLLVLPSLTNYDTPLVDMQFGKFRKGSVLSYQQPLESDCIINIYDGVAFPDLPLEHSMLNNYATTLSSVQIVTFEGLKLNLAEIRKFEQQTRLQSHSPLWFKIRKNRITASKVGDIIKRKKDFEALVERFKNTRNITTAAMQRGLACEPVAARAYSEKCHNKVNLYPSGVIVSLCSPWLAASPDRKIYNPEKDLPFGLLEIKCPSVTSVLEVNYLKKDKSGVLKLKHNHNYYYQILTQLAVTGLKWCDLYIWCENDDHLETIYLDKDMWQDIKDKIDQFYFSYYI